MNRKVSALLLSAVLACASRASAQILYEGFNYTFGENLSNGTPSFTGQLNANGSRWNSAGTLADNLTISSPGLSVTGLAAPVGNAVTWGGGAGTGSASRIAVGPFDVSPAGTTVWYSYALQITDIANLQANTAVGNLIGGFNTLGPPQSGVPGVLGTRIFARQADQTLHPGEFQIGMSRNSSTAGDPSYEVDGSSLAITHPLNTTIFVVGSYTLKSDGSDVSKLWINPDPSTFGAAAAPAPTLMSTAGAALSTRRIESFAYRQSGPATITANTGITADEVRVDTTWAGVTQAPGSAWTADADGNWSSGGWSAGAPNAAGAVANFFNIATAPRTISVDSPQTAGIVNLSSSGFGAWNIAGPATLSLSGSPELNNSSGNNTLSAPLAVSGDFNVNTNAGSKLTTGNVSYSSTGIVRKTGTGAWEVNNVRAGALAVHSVVTGGTGTSGTISGGTLRVLPNGTPTGVTVVNSLLFPQFTQAPQGGEWIPTGSTFDLTNNGLVINYGVGNTSPLGLGVAITSQTNAGIYNLLKLGYNAGAWNGAGISSSTAAASVGSPHQTAVGFAENSQANYTTFMNQSVDAGSLLVRYVYAGDSNLDGKVDLTDFTFLAANFNKPTGAVWLEGDYNYDGKVDLTDFTFLASNFNQSLPAGGGAGGIGAPVPEPASLWLMGSFCAYAMSRARPNRRPS